MNSVHVAGELVDFVERYTISGKEYVEYILRVKRQSGTDDFIHVAIPAERECKISEMLDFWGRVISYRDSDRHTTICVDVDLVSDFRNYANQLTINGKMVDIAAIRTTAGGYPVEEFRFVNDNHYIPCVCWNDDAKLTESLKIGDKILLTGRLQSRKHNKEQRQVYEIAVSGLWLDDMKE